MLKMIFSKEKQISNSFPELHISATNTKLFPEPAHLLNIFPKPTYA